MTRVVAAIAAAVMCSVTACKSREPLGTTANSLSPFVVAASANHGSATASVYVSLPPGSLPAGSIAHVSVERTGAFASVAVEDGGFDPVAVSGAAGDNIAVVIETSGAPLSFNLVAPATKPPVVVRTTPPPNKRDVALSTVIAVVFSEPIDGASLVGGSIQLLIGGAPVAGQLSFADSAHLTVVFGPAAPLLAATDYSLVITQGVRDLSGNALVASMSVPFATQAVATPPASGLVFSSVSAGAVHTCALTSAGTAYCWGANDLGQLGTGNTTDSPVPVPVAGGIKFVQLSAGSDHTCGLTASGTAFCWGDNCCGEVGDRTTTLRTLPVVVPSLLAFRSISAGNWLSCGVTVDGAAYCWGEGDFGQIGVDSASASSPACRVLISTLPPAWPPRACVSPTPVAGGLTFTTVSAGNTNACGVTATGATYCWGEDSYGQLGIGTTTGPAVCFYEAFLDEPQDPTLFSCSGTPVAVVGGLQLQDVHAMGGLGVESTCGLTASGRAYCWGANDRGQLGSGTAAGQQKCTAGLDAIPPDSDWTVNVPCSTAPIAVLGGLTFVQLSSGDVHSCALTAGAVAYCWGDNTYGELGIGTTDASGTPTPVSGGLKFAAVSAGKSTYTNTGHSCGLTTSGTVYCWGANSYGELGTGTTSDSRVPVKVAGQP